MTVAAGDLHEILGPKRFEAEVAMRAGIPGVATGLAWTPVGGDILFIEAARTPGSGPADPHRPARRGDEGERAGGALARQGARRRRSASRPEDSLDKADIHVHVPAGATPKDGPSAGVAMFVALTSLLSNRPVKSDVAMTGEISLRGLVLPIGGVKEKVLAALRAGIKTVMLPARNRRDLEDIPADAREQVASSGSSTSTTRCASRSSRLRRLPRRRRRRCRKPLVAGETAAPTGTADAGSRHHPLKGEVPWLPVFWFPIRPPASWMQDPLFQLQREIDRVFEDVFSGAGGGSGGGGGRSGSMMSAPRIDLQDVEGELRLHADLPGVQPSDLDIRVDGDVLTIRGERKSENERNEQNFHVMERSHGRLPAQHPAAVRPQSRRGAGDGARRRARGPHSEARAAGTQPQDRGARRRSGQRRVGCADRRRRQRRLRW